MTSNVPHGIPGEDAFKTMEKLYQYCPFTKTSLLNCKDCLVPASSFSSTEGLGASFSWALTLHCQKCNLEWVVCPSCGGTQRSHMCKSRQLYFHNRKFHATSDVLAMQPNVSESYEPGSVFPDVAADISFDNTENDDMPLPFLLGDAAADDVDDDVSADSSDEEVSTDESTLDAADLIFATEASTKYFQHEHDRMGAQYLVANSQFEDPLAIKYVDPIEADMQLKIGLLCSELSKGQKQKLALSFNKIDQCHKRKITALRTELSLAKEEIAMLKSDLSSFKAEHDYETASDSQLPAAIEDGSYWDTSLPVTFADIRRKFTEGKYSINQNLPHPKIHVVGDHAYISLFDCIADLLGHGLATDVIEKHDLKVVKYISESKRAQRIMMNSPFEEDDDSLVLWIVEWSDDFDPNNIKRGRASVWMKTVTISRPKSSHSRSTSNTYTIAAGPKDASHEHVESLFKEELMKLSSGEGHLFYHGTMKKLVRVYAELFASLQDQPERRSCNYLKNHNNTYGPHWPYIIPIQEVASKIPACDTCLHYLIHPEDDIIGRKSCTKCTSWQTDVQSGILDFHPPEGFPEEKLPKSKKLKPFKLTYDLLKTAVTETHEKVASGQWTEKEAKAYLFLFSLKDHVAELIVQCALNTSFVKKAEEEKEEKPEAYNYYMMAKKMEPAKYQKWKFPASWTRGTDIEQHIDTIMHLVFLGIIDDVNELPISWMLKQRKNAAFIRFANGVLDSVQSLYLDWCKVRPYKHGEGGNWVSENHLAYARLLKWFFGCVRDVATDPPFEPPPIPQYKWNRPVNEAWLKARGLPAVKGDHLQVRAKVKEYLEQDGGPPPLLPLTGGPFENVENYLTSCSAMVANCMQAEVDEDQIDEVERHVKIFLSMTDKLDNELQQEGKKKKSNPVWVRKSNFICLLNLSTVMREFGSLRALWEGGSIGEAYLRVVKPEIQNAFSKNWHVNVLKKVLKRRANMIVVEKMELNEKLLGYESYEDDSEDEEEGDDVERMIHSKLYHIYKGWSDARKNFYGRKPMSTLQLDNGEFCCAITGDKYVTLTCDEYVGETMSCHYHKWSMDDDEFLQDCDEGDSELPTLSERKIVRFCLLLPKLVPEGLPSCDSEPVYTVIDSEWMELQPDLSFQVPKFKEI